MRTGVTFTDLDMLGRRLSLADAKALLEPLDQTDVLEFCAFLGAVNETGPGPGIAWDTAAHIERLRRLLHDLLPPVYHAKAFRLAAAGPPFTPLVGIALRSLTKLACMWCHPTGGQRLKNVRYRQNVSKVLFGLQGALMDETPIGNADLDWVYRAFPGVARCVFANPRLNLGRDMGRLHGIISRPEVGELLARAHTGMTVDGWFQQEFHVSAKDYRRIVQALAGYAGRCVNQLENLNQLWLDIAAFTSSFPGQEKEVREIFELAATNVDDVAARPGAPEPRTLSEVVYDPRAPLLVRPLLRLGPGHLVTSFEAVFSKFVRGLPYLAHAVAQSQGTTDDRLHKGSRNPTGLIFEGYARWLTRERFRRSDVKVFCGYRVDSAQTAKGETKPERDLLVVVEDIAYPIEVKAKVPTLATRASGMLNELVELVGGLSRQAMTAADALVNGTCRSEDGTTIPPVRKAFPCVLVFERFPIRFPFSDAFEEELSKSQKRSLFSNCSTTGPLQVFDIDSFEDWDKAYHLPNETTRLFNAIQKRATTPSLRYESLVEIRKGEDGVEPKWKSLLDELCDESEMELSGRNGLPATDTTSRR